MPMSSTLDQARWLHQNGTEVKHSLETQNPIGSTFITIGIQRSQCRPNHNPCSDHVRAPKTTRMTIVRIKYSSVYREINISPHKNINSVMKFFETYEFSPQLTTRSSRKPISSPRRHNRTQTVCDLACRKGLDVLDLPPDIQPYSRRSTSRTIIVSKIVHGKTLHKFGACNWYTDTYSCRIFVQPSTKLLPVAQMGVVGRS
ncbi:hypothetical protein HID58_029599 [Brassica napus]|uniref:Uncharacterized protein n=1 Tax=Brassica napus TaxID=3708 RepID=A0ABQ8CDN5_BRANA|nr:hypothetical protein HID58_029599 [Brassica napus]